MVILELLNEFDLLPDEVARTDGATFFVIDAAPELFDHALSLVAKLRSAGFHAVFSYRRQALGKQLKQASQCHAARAVIVGHEFTERGVLSVKDLKTKQQQELPLASFLANPLGGGDADRVSSATSV